MKVEVFSSLLIIIGGINIPGIAMPIREGTTCEIAAIAALELSPTFSPNSVSISMPFLISYYKQHTKKHFSGQHNYPHGNRYNYNLLAH
jgi:hypothetical protein